MELRWWWVVIAACVALAAGIVVAMLGSVGRQGAVRPLANVSRLTSLPAYVRAARRRAVATVATVALLGIALTASVVTAARPTGLPTAALDTATAQPEDVMVCAGATPDDPAVAAAMRWFAGLIPSFDTQRIGLTSLNRRVVPMTRDHQFAIGRFAEYSSFAATGFAPAVAYANYAPHVDDVLALCITGFPGFEAVGAQRRSLVYLGPGTLPGDDRPAVFDAERLRDLVRAAGVQVNVVTSDPPNPGLADLAAATGGRSYRLASGVAGALQDIREHPPAPTDRSGPQVRASTPDTPDAPLGIALVALAGLALIPLTGWRP